MQVSHIPGHIKTLFSKLLLKVFFWFAVRSKTLTFLSNLNAVNLPLVTSNFNKSLSKKSNYEPLDKFNL